MDRSPIDTEDSHTTVCENHVYAFIFANKYVKSFIWIPSDSNPFIHI